VCPLGCVVPAALVVGARVGDTHDVARRAGARDEVVLVLDPLEVHDADLARVRDDGAAVQGGGGPSFGRRIFGRAARHRPHTHDHEDQSEKSPHVGMMDFFSSRSSSYASRVRRRAGIALLLYELMVACGGRGGRSSSPRALVVSAPAASAPALPPATPAPEPECPRGPIATFGYTLDELALPDATTAKAIAVRGGRVWILTPDTLMEHDGKRVVRETALCVGEMAADRTRRTPPTSAPAPLPGYRYVTADERGALALGTSGVGMLVSRVDLDGQLHCRRSTGIYPASPVSEDGVWLARTKTGVEIQDETGWRSAEASIEHDAIPHGVAGRRHAFAHSLRPRGPRTVYEFDGVFWSPRWGLPRDFSYTWMSTQGVVFAHSLPRPALHGNRAREAPTCEVVVRIAGRSVVRSALPMGFRPNAIVGREETDLWFAGGENVLHWDGKLWRQATPPLRAADGVVDEEGAFWFVGARSATGWPHPALYRVRRK
jgi:hypothetical protein